MDLETRLEWLAVVLWTRMTWGERFCFYTVPVSVAVAMVLGWLGVL